MDWVDELKLLEGNGSIQEHQSTFPAIESLIQKNVDVTLNDKGVLLYYSNTLPEFNIQINEIGTDGKEADVYELVMLSNKNKEGLTDKINTGLANIVEDGTYEKIYIKWFGVAPNQLPVAPKQVK